MPGIYTSHSLPYDIFAGHVARDFLHASALTRESVCQRFQGRITRRPSCQNPHRACCFGRTQPALKLPEAIWLESLGPALECVMDTPRTQLL